MRTHRVVPSLVAGTVALAIFFALACVEAGDAVGGAVDERSAEAFAALPVAVLVPDAPLCGADPLACIPVARPFGAVGPAGDAIVALASGRRAEIARVNAGTDSAFILGREGDGPGEYRLPGLVALAPNGDAIVFDILSRRVLRYGRDGAARSTAQVTLPPAPIGGFGAVAGEVRMLSTELPATPGDSMVVHVFALDSARPARQLHALPVRVPSFGIGEFRSVPPVLAAQDWFALRGDGAVAFSDGKRFGLSLFGPDGGLVRRVVFDLPTRAPADAEITEALDAQVRGIPDPRAREAVKEQMRGNVAARMPAATGLTAMHDGELWLRAAPRVGGDSVDWLVLSAAAEPRRRVLLSTTDAVLAKHGARYLVVRDEEDGPRFWWMSLR